jgi:hypothetical protein
VSKTHGYPIQKLWEDSDFILIYDFNLPWSMAIVVFGFLSAWLVTNAPEHLGVTRVPGKACLKRNRPVGYGMIGRT